MKKIILMSLAVLITTTILFTKNKNNLKVEKNKENKRFMIKKAAIIRKEKIEKLDDQSKDLALSLIEIEKSFLAKDDEHIKKNLKRVNSKLDKYLVKAFSISDLDSNQKLEFLRLFRTRIALNKVLLDRELENLL